LYASVTITVKFNLNALVRDLWPTLYIQIIWMNLTRYFRNSRTKK